LRFLTQSNCNVFENFEGVSAVIIELIWCNWFNSDWHPFFSTSTPLTFQPPSPESMHTLTI